MRQRPFIFQNVVVDRQCRERVRRAVTERLTDFTFHSENSGALHVREIGKDVAMRCEIVYGQLWPYVFNPQRNNAHAHFGGAEFAHG